MILILIFIASFAAILGIFYMFKVPFIPSKGPWKEVLFNLIMAAVLAAMFDRGLILIAAVILCGKLLWEKASAIWSKFKTFIGIKEEPKKDV